MPLYSVAFAAYVGLIILLGANTLQCYTDMDQNVPNRRTSVTGIVALLLLSITGVVLIWLVSESDWRTFWLVLLCVLFLTDAHEAYSDRHVDWIYLSLLRGWVSIGSYIGGAFALSAMLFNWL